MGDIVKFQKMTIFMSFWSFSPTLFNFVNFRRLASLVFGLVVKNLVVYEAAEKFGRL